MGKAHIWLSQYEWLIFTKFLEIWRKNNRQPVTTLFCQTEGLVGRSLFFLRSLNVIELRRGIVCYWSPALDVNVGVMIAREDRDIQEAHE